MKRAFQFFVVLLLSFHTLCAQQVHEDGMECLRLKYTTPRLEVTYDTCSHLHLDGYELGGELGTPALPVKTSLIEIPFCQQVEVVIFNAVYDTLPLPLPVASRQPSVSKNPRLAARHYYDSAVYSAQQYVGNPLFHVQPLGIARDRQLALLHYSPIQVNPVENMCIVCRSAEVLIRYDKVDEEKTIAFRQRFGTPSFGLASPINALPVKEVRSTAPVRLTIVAGSLFSTSEALQQFVRWKRTQGLLVDLMYVQGSASTVKNKIQKLFDEATPSSPAPTYILLVGDVAQVPAFNSDLSSSNYMHDFDYQCDDHVTDHYYTTITDDNLPDCYIGRFSASDTATLRSIVEKTILYESYSFSDDSYLQRAALVAGVDNLSYLDTSDCGFQYADPTMDYIAYNYVNADQGYTDVSYYKNNSSYAPTGVVVTGNNRSSLVSQQLVELYNSGLGWINYSAHGASDMWAKPTFTSSQAAKMSNYGMPSFMIGNCCLTNHFDTPTCFGEALLRRSGNAGAAAYIGCSNSSFWEEDLIWSVGMRSYAHSHMSVAYNEIFRGMYDHLFHTHGEGYGQQAVTAGRMLAAGVMAVNDRGCDDLWYTSMNEYYWEIYNLLGDPTLMPWLGKAKQLPISTVTFKPNEQMLTVEAPNGAYVAIVGRDSLQLMASAYAWSDGLAYLPMCDEGYDSCFLSITAQGYRPCFLDFSAIPVSADGVADQSLVLAPNPAHASCTLSVPGLRHVQVFDMLGRLILDVDAADTYVLNLREMPAGVYTVCAATLSGRWMKRLLVK